MRTHHDPACPCATMVLASDQFARLHAHLIDRALSQVDDADAAEDLVQETLIAAWQAGAGWSPAALDRALADRCRCYRRDWHQHGTHSAAAHDDETMPARPMMVDRLTTDAGLDEVELRLTIVEGVRRSPAGELGVAVFALRLAGLRPADVRAALGGSPKAVNDALATLGRVARRVLGQRPAAERSPDRPRRRERAPSPPPLVAAPTRRPSFPPVPAPDLVVPQPASTDLPPVPSALAQTHPIAAALVRAGLPVIVSPAVPTLPASAAASELGDDDTPRPAPRATTAPTGAVTRAQRLRAQQQERARAVERAGRYLDQMRRCRERAQTAAERAAADARLAAAAIRYERARAVLGDLEQRRDARPATTPDPHPRAGQVRRGRR